MTADEARARGTHQALTPVVDVAREPRWGRVEETYGEDPFLVSRMGIAAVRGFQGDATFRDKTRVIATLKHFAAHGQPESGMNCAPVNVSVRVLRETFLFPFKEASGKGRRDQRDGVLQRNRRRAVACQPVAAARRAAQGMGLQGLRGLGLLRHLRTELPPGHRTAISWRKDKSEACALAVQAGVNIELPEPDCYLHLVELVRKGVLKESQLDELVAPMLYWKFQMGLFDDPYVDPGGGGARRGLRRASRTGAAGGARDDHAAEERRQPCCRLIWQNSRPSR